MLEAFASSRLLVLDGDTVQIAHDVLLRAWPRLRGWLDSEQASWILYTQLQEDAARWAGTGGTLPSCTGGASSPPSNRPRPGGRPTRPVTRP